MAGGWRLKCYVMTVSSGMAMPQGLRAAAMDRAAAVLADVTQGHGVGYVVIHRARPANFVLIDWWEREVDLRQRYFRSEHTAPGTLEEMPAEVVGCVWELEILLHERDAWISSVLNLSVPDYDGYLADVYQYPGG